MSSTYSVARTQQQLRRAVPQRDHIVRVGLQRGSVLPRQAHVADLRRAHKFSIRSDDHMRAALGSHTAARLTQACAAPKNRLFTTVISGCSLCL